jgi:hypothetical protein
MSGDGIGISGALGGSEGRLRLFAIDSLQISEEFDPRAWKTRTTFGIVAVSEQ